MSALLARLLCVGLIAAVPVRPSLASPDIQQWESANGAKVLFVQASELPMLDIQLVFDAGSARDGKLPGLARLTHNLLDEGSGEWSADEISNRFEDVGAQYSASVERDKSSVSLRSLVDPELLTPAIDTFISVVAEPNFPERAFERIKRQMLVELQNQSQNPADIASKAFYSAIYGDHPFATPVSGTEETIQSITRAEVMDFHKRYLVASNATLAIVGDLSMEQAKQLAEKITGSLTRGTPPMELPEVLPLKESKTVHVPFPSEQAHVYIGQPGIRRGDKDYFSLYTGNHVLGGGGFGSRLMTEVREKRGLSYSVYSYFQPQKVAGPYLIGLQTRIDQADLAANLALETVREFVRKGPDKEELEASRKNITGGFPLLIDSNSSILGYLSLIGFYNLPLDYLDTFNSNIEKVTAESIRESFSKQLDTNRMVTVIVGGEQKS